MSRRFTRISLVLALLLSSEVWAVGLGDIRLGSALNEPLRAEIELLSATPEELNNLTVALASAETFARYGIDRPFYLQGIQFNVSTGPNGPIVQLRSAAPITEPFLTFLVEATWSSGRLLREYTVLLDPPTYAPPATQQAPAVTAPTRTTPADSGRIERAQPTPTPTPTPQPAPPQQTPRPAAGPAPQPAAQPAATAEPEPQQPRPPVDDTTYDTAYDTVGGDEFVVRRSQTLWSIARHLRPDSRLTINQTMLAIYEANPQAFGGNINVLRAGATLRVPSADEVFQINRGEALAEVQRQHAAWGGGAGYTPPPTTTRPSLTLVPPDEEPAGQLYDESVDEAPISREQEIEARIAELEAADVPDQPSLIEIRDNELANLRQELANIRGEVYEPPVEDSFDEALADDEILAEDALADEEPLEVEDTDIMADEEEAIEDEIVAEAEETTVPTNIVRTSSREPGLVDKIISALTSTWAFIVYVLLVVAGLLLWFVRRGRDDLDDSGPWERLDRDEDATGSMSATETMHAPSPDDAFVVVEQESVGRGGDDATIEAPSPTIRIDADDDTGRFGSLEDTFSSETAVNLDQTDPMAEADFHMAYGLYDQAADLINGALASDPGDKALLAKLCEIYFVWGNQDAFIDAADRMKAAVGSSESAEWDKIVIMGQQIAGEHPLFAGAGVAGATRAVDLSFDSDEEGTGALDMDFGTEQTGESDIIDLGADDAPDEGMDFLFGDSGTDDNAETALDLDVTAQSPTMESPADDATAAMPGLDATAESPTIEEQFAGMGGTSELPAIDDDFGLSTGAGHASDETAEINLDDLDLDLDGLDETEVASFDDLDETGTNEALDDTSINRMLEDSGAVTGKNLEFDPDSTGLQERLDASSMGLDDEFDLEDPDTTGIRLAPDETGRSPMLDAEAEMDADLLDATGHTQVLPDDFAVGTGVDLEEPLPDDAETLLASLDDDDDFDFAKTEALPADVFTGNSSLDETGELPAVAGTDVDLDLEDLTAALQVSDAMGDTVEQPRDDATVEQPRPSMGDETAEVPTMSIGPDDMSDDLQDARTMTEVGTKLDLARAYVDMGDPAGARSILEEVLDEGDEAQRQQAQQLLDSLPS